MSGFSRLIRAISRLPLMTCSRLLKSCAMPADNWPMASIFCACRFDSSMLRRSVMSIWEAKK